jgi:hypothetical protein
MKYLIIMVMLLSGCASMEQQQYSERQTAHQSEFNAHMKATKNDYDAGKISNVEYSKRQLMLNEHYFPDGHRTQAAIRDRIAYAEALERGDITKLEYDILWNARFDKYLQAKTDNEARHQRELAEQQDQPMSPVQAMIMMNMINSTSSNLRHSMDYPARSTTNCNSYTDFSGVVRTTCY